MIFGILHSFTNMLVGMLGHALNGALILPVLRSVKQRLPRFGLQQTNHIVNFDIVLVLSTLFGGQQPFVRLFSKFLNARKHRCRWFSRQNLLSLLGRQPSARGSR